MNTSSSHGPRRGNYSSFRARRSFNKRGPSRRGGFRGGSKININRFINKATEDATPEVPHVPKHTFNDFVINSTLKATIAERGFTLPTPIQDAIIPHILFNKDVVGLANTGTGKTAAFLIPLIHQAMESRQGKSLIIVPTRELANQINDEFRAFAKGAGVYSVVCVGGSSMYRQMSDLRRVHQFVIGTPGRLKDLIERKAINLSHFTKVVLDEADRMLDMGFIGDMKFIIHSMPAQRQGLFFSATLSPSIEGLIKDFLRSPVMVSVKTRETSKNIEQDVVRYERDKKFDKLCELLAGPDFKKVIIFGQMKHAVEKLSVDLIKKGFKADSLHGNKSQNHRQRTLSAFKSDGVQILVATDVAARGLDIPDISHVINYDLPQTEDDYTHRIGRTGRGSKKGKALTFIE
jgi:superfamily II DNA/RNA helicase